MLVEVSRLKLGLNMVVSFRGSQMPVWICCVRLFLCCRTRFAHPIRALLSFNFINLIVIWLAFAPCRKVSCHFAKPSEPYAKGLFLTINKRRLHLVARSFRLFCKSSCLSNKAFRFFLFAASWSSHKIRKPLFLTLLFFYLKPYNLCLEPNNVLSQASLPYVTTPLPSFFSGNRHILPCSTAGHRLCWTLQWRYFGVWAAACRACRTPVRILCKRSARVVWWCRRSTRGARLW